MIEQSSRTYTGLVAAILLFSIISSMPHFASAATPTGVVVPLYMGPSSIAWNTIIAIKNAHPSVPMAVIINPNNGPGSSISSSYVTGINNMKAANVMVLGYVYTSYCARAQATIESDIDNYHNWYGVNGIHFDEMQNNPGCESYYTSLTNYVKSHGMTYTSGNPGTTTSSSYVGTVDNLHIYEIAGMPSTSTLSSATFSTTYSKSGFSFIAYGVSTLNDAAVIADSNYVGYMYVTNDNLSNPYDTIAPYLSNLVADLDTGSAPTPSPLPSQSTTVSLTVNSADLSGIASTGMWVELNDSSGSRIASGFTPTTFSVISGAQYTVHAANWQNIVFNHWNDGNTSPARIIVPTQTTTFTAYYSTGSTTTSPGSPTGLAATATSTSQINLSWTAPSGTVSGYDIERSTDGGSK